MLTQAELKTKFTYNPDTGLFTSIAGKEYSSEPTASKLYARLGVDYKVYYQHRLAWLYMYGYFPEYLDHKDCDKANNKLSNLRECTITQNSANCKPRKGLKGASKRWWGNVWRARANIKGRSIYLGIYKTEQEAHDAYCAFTKPYHGEFFRAK